MKSRWIVHNGKRLFYADFSNFGADSAVLKEESKAVVALVTQEPLDSVLALSDVRGTTGTPESLAIMKGVVSRTTRYVRKRATVGLSGIRRALIDAVNRLSGAKQFTCFDDVKAAEDWLTEE